MIDPQQLKNILPHNQNLCSGLSPSFKELELRVIIDQDLSLNSHVNIFQKLFSDMKYL